MSLIPLIRPVLRCDSRLCIFQALPKIDVISYKISYTILAPRTQCLKCLDSSSRLARPIVNLAQCSNIFHLSNDVEQN